MAVHIRLQRRGSTHRPFYHLVAADSRCARNGKFLEKLGYYDPKTEPSTIELDAERVQHWYAQGAQPSATATKLLKIKKVELTRARPTKAATES